MHLQAIVNAAGLAQSAFSRSHGVINASGHLSGDVGPIKVTISQDATRGTSKEVNAAAVANVLVHELESFAYATSQLLTSVT